MFLASSLSLWYEPGMDWYVAVLALTSLGLRVLPRMMLPHAVMSDTFFHLYMSKEIRKNRFRKPNVVDRVMIGNKYDYPFLYHFLLALFPHDKTIWIVERVISPFFDTVNAVVVYYFALAVFPKDLWPQATAVARLAMFLYVFLPACLRNASGPRAYNGSPRVFGQSLFCLHLYFSFYCLNQFSWVTFVLAALFAGLLTVSTKFGNQVLIFFAAIIGNFFPLYAVLILASYAVAILLFGKKAVAVYVGQFKFLTYYYKHLQAVFIKTDHSLGQYFKAVSYRVKRLIQDKKVSAFLEWYYSENHILHLLLTCFFPFISVVHAYLNGFHFLFGVMTSALTMAFITSRKKIMFLGECERYLEYALMPAVVVLAHFLVVKNLTVLAGILNLYILASAVFFVKQYRRGYLQLQRQVCSSQAFFDALSQHSGDEVILPLGSFHWQCLYRSPCRLLTYTGNLDLAILTPDDFYLVFGNYPYPSNELEKIIVKYNVKFIVTDDAHLDHYVKNILTDASVFNRCFREVKLNADLRLFVRADELNKQITNAGV